MSGEKKNRRRISNQQPNFTPQRTRKKNTLNPKLMEGNNKC